MIHELLLTLDEALPLIPPLVIAAMAVLLIAPALLLYGRSKGTLLFSIATALLALGLVVGLVGVDRPGGSLRWGALRTWPKTWSAPRPTADGSRSRLPALS